MLASALALLVLSIPVHAEGHSGATVRGTVSSGARHEGREIGATGVITLYLPFVGGTAACPPIAGESYSTIAPTSAPTDRPAELHPDLNLAMRGYVSTTADLRLVDVNNPTDAGAPQLAGLFGDNRTGVFSAAYQVNDWDWMLDRRSTPILVPPVTLAGLVVSPGEIIRVPPAGYDLGRAALGYQVMVLYAGTTRITLKYTREDNVVYGYTLHLENVCVEPGLLALYQATNAAGRVRLPALLASQAVGRAMSDELRVAIRDTGTFMDPRARSDWWQGR